VETPAPDPADVATIDAIVRALYESVSFEPGQPPSWDRLRSLCAPGARLIRGSDPATGQRTADAFVAEAQEQIARGALPSFHEREIARSTMAFGNLAHVFSTYEARRAAGAADVMARGINSIQLWRRGNRWWVVGVLWDEETGDHPIPDNYLPFE
jgi:hypothetical protein